MKISLKNKIVFSVSGIILLIGSLATLTLFFIAKQQFVSYEKQDLNQIAHRSKDELESFFETEKVFVKTIASQPEFAEYLSSKEGDTPQESRISDILKRYEIGDKYFEVYLVDTRGDILFSTCKDGGKRNCGSNQYFKKALEGEVGIDMVSRKSGEAGYYFSAPVRNNDKIKGVLVTKLKAKEVNKLVKEENGVENLEGGINLMLVNSQGIVITSTDKDREYKSLSELDLNRKEEMEMELKFGDRKIEALKYDKVYRKLGSDASLQFYDERDEEEEIVELRKIEGTPFSFVLEAGTERINDFVFNISIALAGFVFLALIVSLLLVYLLVDWFMKPLYKIEEGIKEVDQGNYQVNIDVDSGDELEHLADLLNKLINNLAKSKKEADKKIEENTERLRKINKAMAGRELKMRELKKENKKLKENQKGND